MCIVFQLQISIATPWIYACNFDKPSYAWFLKSSGMWCCLVGWVVPDFAKGCSAFHFRVQQSFFLDCWTLKIKGLDPLKHWGTLAWQNSITSMQHWCWYPSFHIIWVFFLGGVRGELAVMCLSEYRFLLRSSQLPYQYQAIQMNTWHWS